MENKCVKMDFTNCLRSSSNVFEVFCFLNVSASSNETHFRIFTIITEVNGGLWRSVAEVGDSDFNFDSNLNSDFNFNFNLMLCILRYVALDSICIWF